MITYFYIKRTAQNRYEVSTARTRYAALISGDDGEIIVWVRCYNADIAGKYLDFMSLQYRQYKIAGKDVYEFKPRIVKRLIILFTTKHMAWRSYFIYKLILFLHKKMRYLPSKLGTEETLAFWDRKNPQPKPPGLRIKDRWVNKQLRG